MAVRRESIEEDLKIDAAERRETELEFSTFVKYGAVYAAILFGLGYLAMGVPGLIAAAVVLFVLGTIWAIATGG